MSGAIPCPAAPATAPCEPGADVIDLAHRRRAQQGEGAVDAADVDSPRARLAQTIQALYHAHGVTLTDERCAAAHVATLEWVHLLLDGAAAKGLVDSAVVGRLQAMVTEAQGASEAL